MDIAIIGGTGIDESVRFGETRTIATPFGEAEIVDARLDDTRFLFVPRHGTQHSLPPSLINYRAQIAALRILGITVSGSARADWQLSLKTFGQCDEPHDPKYESDLQAG